MELSIEPDAVATLVRQELPEFARIVDDHLRDWPEDPMLYILVGDIFTALCDVPPGRERVLLVGRADMFADRMLNEGSQTVRGCFAIEFIEPLMDLNSAEHYPDFETVLGPLGGVYWRNA